MKLSMVSTVMENLRLYLCAEPRVYRVVRRLRRAMCAGCEQASHHAEPEVVGQAFGCVEVA